jgi:hypothetical protein
MSDLHTEFLDSPLHFCSKLDIAPDLDFLILAGDIVVPAKMDINQVHGVLDFFSKQARHVLFAEGNHELYSYRGTRGDGTRIPLTACDHILATLESVMPKNYTWLRNNAVILDGVHFYGGTMWFRDSDGMNCHFRDHVNDWEQVANLHEWVYSTNAAFTRNAMELVTPETIVISHHLPHPRSTPPYYKNDVNGNRFFVCDQTALIAAKQPRFWFHGHTHAEMNYMLGDTHVMAHPRGYPKEQKHKARYQALLLEV